MATADDKLARALSKKKNTAAERLPRPIHLRVDLLYSEGGPRTSAPVGTRRLTSRGFEAFETEKVEAPFNPTVRRKRAASQDHSRRDRCDRNRVTLTDFDLSLCFVANSLIRASGYCRTLCSATYGSEDPIGRVFPSGDFGDQGPIQVASARYDACAAGKHLPCNQRGGAGLRAVAG
jgi:hypothetical protein